jgi:peroxiredoxin
MIRSHRVGAVLVALAFCVVSRPTPVAGADKETQDKDKKTHEKLKGYPAPAVKADFALNAGKKIPRLADSKGKVVLLVLAPFWSCYGAAPEAQAWYKENRDPGLEVLVVTPYPSEFNHKLTFDPATAKLHSFKTKKANTQHDRQVLEEFATYHKLEFPLLMVPRDEAERLVDVYGWHTSPQFVVIDRSGIVRLIRVTSEPETLKDVEREIKRLLDLSK